MSSTGRAGRSWQQRVRLVLAVCGLTLAGVLVYLSRREPPPPPPPPEIARLEPNVSLASNAGTQMILDRTTGQPDLQITFAGSRMYTDGRMRWERASIAEVGEGGSKLSADTIETGSRDPGVDRPSQYQFAGNVRMESGDGLVVETDAATYDDTTGVIMMPGAVKYQRGRLSGTATGAVYDRQQEIITLQKDAVANVAPDATEQGSAQATAARMMLARGQHSLLMEENARIVSGSETLSGDKATLLFTDDETAVKYIELRGNARVEPSVDGRAGMSAQDITMTVRPDGSTMQHATLTTNAELRLHDKEGPRTVRASWIDLDTAPDGQTLTALRARDKVSVDVPATATAAGRLITADTLDARGDEKRGLTSARFEGNPKLEERPASGKPGKAKTATANVIVLALGGQIDAVERAEFHQDVRFTEGESVATAGFATYTEKDGRLELRPGEGKAQSRVVRPELNVDARDINLVTGTEDLVAITGVRTTMVRDKSKPKTAGTLFEGTQPIIGAADRLEYRGESGRATYTGTAKVPASLIQGNTAIRALGIDFTERTGLLTAKGAVDSALQMAATEADARAGKLKAYNVRAETLTYDDAKRTAIYQGALAVLTTVDAEIEGRTLTFVLAEASRTLQTMRVEGDIYARLESGHEAVGDRLEFDAATNWYTLVSTRPNSVAQVKAPPEQTASGTLATECAVSRSTTIRFNIDTGNVDMPGSGQANQFTEKKPCTLSLRSNR